MLSEIVENFDNDLFIENILKLLEKEKEIEFKKMNGEKLTSEEIFFDKYQLKPSYILSSLSRRIKSEKNNSGC